MDTDDRCYLGGFPANGLKDVFGVWAEETDSLPQDKPGKAEYNGRDYSVDHICDIIHAQGSEVLGVYTSDFYAGQPSVTVNRFGKGKAYYAAFCNEYELADALIGDIVNDLRIRPDADIKYSGALEMRKRGDLIFLLNFTDEEQTAELDKDYVNVMNGAWMLKTITIPPRGYVVLKERE